MSEAVSELSEMAEELAFVAEELAEATEQPETAEEAEERKSGRPRRRRRRRGGRDRGSAPFAKASPRPVKRIKRNRADRSDQSGPRKKQNRERPRYLAGMQRANLSARRSAKRREGDRGRWLVPWKIARLGNPVAQSLVLPGRQRSLPNPSATRVKLPMNFTTRNWARKATTTRPKPKSASAAFPPGKRRWGRLFRSIPKPAPDGPATAARRAAAAAVDRGRVRTNAVNSIK